MVGAIIVLPCNEQGPQRGFRYALDSVGTTFSLQVTEKLVLLIAPMFTILAFIFVPT